MATASLPIVAPAAPPTSEVSREAKNTCEKLAAKGFIRLREERNTLMKTAFRSIPYGISPKPVSYTPD